MAKAKAWYNSPAYQRILCLRTNKSELQATGALATAGHFAVPNPAPTVCLSIDAVTAALREGDEAQILHAGRNRGAMLAVGYWREGGCRGHIELREHTVITRKGGGCSYGASRAAVSVWWISRAT